MHRFYDVKTVIRLSLVFSETLFVARLKFATYRYVTPTSGSLMKCCFIINIPFLLEAQKILGFFSQPDGVNIKIPRLEPQFTIHFTLCMQRIGHVPRALWALRSLLDCCASNSGFSKTLKPLHFTCNTKYSVFLRISVSWYKQCMWRRFHCKFGWICV